MSPSKEMAEYLRARREQVTPEDVGLPVAAKRRVAGLRREEVALLAEISVDYYTRLEQGRVHRPSEHVLKTLARALRLDEMATAHLYRLARTDPPRGGSGSGLTVRPELQALLDAWTSTPAVIQNQRLDVLASNSSARALSPSYRPGTNLLRAIFLDPEVRERQPDIERDLPSTVAYFRSNLGAGNVDPYVQQIVQELSSESRQFRELWVRHDVNVTLTGEKTYMHPLAGELRFHFETLSVPGAEALTMLVLIAAPGSQAARALTLLLESDGVTTGT